MKNKTKSPIEIKFSKPELELLTLSLKHLQGELSDWLEDNIEQLEEADSSLITHQIKKAIELQKRLSKHSS